MSVILWGERKKKKKTVPLSRLDNNQKDMWIQYNFVRINHRYYDVILNIVIRGWFKDYKDTLSNLKKKKKQRALPFISLY